MSSAITETSVVFDALVNGRGTAKAAAIKAIEDGSSGIDRERLKILVNDALLKEYVPPPPNDPEEDMITSDTRCWLLSALGRLCGDDPEAGATVRRHLGAAYEPYYWARFWAFEGLIASNPPDLQALARGIEKREGEAEVVRNLATAVLASRGDAEPLRKIQEDLNVEPKTPQEHRALWATLRALRVVPIANINIVNRMCALVGKGAYEDVTYDAIIALGKLKPGTRQAENAAHALAQYLTRFRWPMYQAMRARALFSLGNLRVERSAPVLVEELSDDSPAITYEAARALEKVLGVRMAVPRVIEAATKAGRGQLDKYASALRWMNRARVVEELEAAMLSGADDQQEIARGLLSEIGGLQALQKLRARTVAINQYMSVLEEAEKKIRELFEASLREARSGFKLATLMDVTVFTVGIGLIVASAVMALRSGGGLDQWAGVSPATTVSTGALGVLGVLYGILIAKPREKIQESIDNLMQLKVVFLGYLRQLHQTDQAYTRRMLENEPLDADEVRRFADMVNTIMTAAVQELRGREKTPTQEHIARA